MPGWYIHLEVARKAFGSLRRNPDTADPFAENGPSAQALQHIAQTNPAYTALGAIGPDIFFLLPDFKPPIGSFLWQAGNLIDQFYSWWEGNFLGPFNQQLKPLELNASDALGA